MNINDIIGEIVRVERTPASGATEGRYCAAAEFDSDLGGCQLLPRHGSSSVKDWGISFEYG